jgi:hypothetical protein
MLSWCFDIPWERSPADLDEDDYLALCEKAQEITGLALSMCPPDDRW